VTLKEKMFECQHCQQTFQDNLSFLEHQNTQQHLKRVGFQRGERATVEQVRARLEHGRNAQVKGLKEGNGDAGDKKDKKDKKESLNTQETNDPMALMMGFASFGSSKRQ
jgi:hypothetical protein